MQGVHTTGLAIRTTPHANALRGLSQKQIGDLLPLSVSFTQSFLKHLEGDF